MHSRTPVLCSQCDSGRSDDGSVEAQQAAEIAGAHAVRRQDTIVSRRGMWKERLANPWVVGQYGLCMRVGALTSRCGAR